MEEKDLEIALSRAATVERLRLALVERLGKPIIGEDARFQLWREATQLANEVDALRKALGEK